MGTSAKTPSSGKLKRVSLTATSGSLLTRATKTPPACGRNRPSGIHARCGVTAPTAQLLSSLKGLKSTSRDNSRATKTHNSADSGRSESSSGGISAAKSLISFYPLSLRSDLRRHLVSLRPLLMGMGSHDVKLINAPLMGNERDTCS